MRTFKATVTDADGRTEPSADPRQGDGAALSQPARILLACVIGAAALVDVLALGSAHADAHVWLGFAALATLAATAQLFVVNSLRNHGYHTTIAFLLAAVILLPWWAAVLIPLVQHGPEWLRQRYRWYIQVFNVANYTLDVLAASATFHLVVSSSPGDDGMAFALAAVAAVAVFVLLNHGLLALMLRVGRGHRVRHSGLFSAAGLAPDLVLALIGVVIALTWRSNGYLVVAAVAPLLLVHRSLEVPVLEQQTRTDPKTGLLNARHFDEVLRAELDRSGGRFRRPLSVIVADIDHFRAVNNTRGHLAGDAVLVGLADVLRRELRENDVAARFGGEEFALLLRNTRGADAYDVAERLRTVVAGTAFHIATSPEPVRITMSCGVATSGESREDAIGLLHRADLALYEAKAQGRNRARMGPLAGADAAPVEVAS
jgi:diguanylate cyclase (GGDEF)-like protein